MFDSREAGDAAIRWLVFGTAIVLLFLCVISIANARDLGQWEQSDPAISAWFKSVKMPDHPTVSCCGEADAWYADETENGPNGELIAVITDERSDEPLRRRHIPVGTKIVVPPEKIQWRYGNPVGHTIIFLNPDNQVWCYIQNGGV
jgi:hypothetical protein